MKGKVNSSFTMCICLLLLTSALFSQTIEEKKLASTQSEAEGNFDLYLDQVNQRIASLRERLKAEMALAGQLHEVGAEDEEYFGLLQSVQSIKEELTNLQERWRKRASQNSKKDEEGYALWDQEETTLAALVMEFGASDYLYIVPPEMINMKITMHSSMPIPREAWGEVLEIILAQNGVGVKQINPYTRQLYIFKQDPSAVEAIASSLEDIRHIQDHRRIFYVFSPPVEHVKSAFQFFERFSDPKMTFVYNIGGKVAIVSTKQEVEKLLNLYRTVWQDPNGKVSKVVTVSKMSIREMEKILKTFFSDSLEKPMRPPFGKIDNEGLSIITPQHGNALVLMGQREIVDRAEKLVCDTENQLQDPAEMTIYIYNCKHSDPIDLAKVMDRVYYSLFHAVPEFRENIDVTAQVRAQNVPPDGYANAPGLTVPPQRFKPEIETKIEIDIDSEHFIPDPKTGNLLMVVRRDVLGRIKDLLHRLDVPKKMVQIEILLFEKKLNNQSNYGLNLLKFGNANNGSRYDGPNLPPKGGLNDPVGTGVLFFLFSGGKSKHFPAFDLAYSFLMTQEDIQLNAAPSVITVNQTPATISILEEISLNNGAAPIDTNKGIAFEKSFTRAQYGINIILTPIIHLFEEFEECECQSGKGFITLQTNITFDTTKQSKDDRPPVDKRHIENEVRVYDGQTIILGGLRRKSVRDSTQKVPFLGEIPGLGKLFGSTELTDDSTEMFFFITPKIITDPREDLLEMRCRELERRPGDIPEFLCRLMEARECEKKRLFRSSIRTFFGEKQHYYYD
ncbi:MAG: Type II secretion system protein D [Chlamydiae bacterium]|nr:Type II secretion system protein D [Chlamydiota bacterium]